ncbi:MAG: hypothetical protein GYA80_01020, partial [Chloroflexi bacterium]|nr:hypothetical protein [Chloroflexota bacterium]
MNLDIATTVTVAFVILLAFVLIFLLSGIRSIRAGQKLFFFRKRRELTMRGWRLILISILLGGLAFTVRQFAEPTIYRVFP